MSVRSTAPAVLAVCLLAAACGREEAAPSAAASPPPTAPATPADLPRGLLLALSTFTTVDGKPVPSSELVVLTRRAGAWQAQAFHDADSNVFHKAMVYAPAGQAPAVITLGGMQAAIKRWERTEARLAPAETLWQARFGGKFDRMRDAEAGDLDDDGGSVLAVATHDQGVVAIVRPKPGGGWQTEEIDHEADTFVHEIEIGDLDGDGVREVYATPSAPNKLDGTPQPGTVVRYVPAKREGRTLVADLGLRHAKEILVSDVDGDGRDELYVSVEAAEGGSLEVKRYDAGTAPSDGAVVVTLADPMCRFLTAGDVDGDGKRELVLAAKDTGLWLARPGADPHAPWPTEAIDADSAGFEHAALLTDLDGDATDELYAASDKQGELRRYVWVEGKPVREVIYTRGGEGSVLTWNLAPLPVELAP
jgi:hypothetical protein